MRRTMLLAAAVSTTLVLSGCLGQEQESDSGKNADAKDVTLTITSNSVAGGKNEHGAKWINDWVIPQFTKQQKDKGVNVKIKFDGVGVDDAEYKAKIALDFGTDIGGDLIEIDGIWLGEFAQGGQVRPLDDVVGKDKVDGWDGWDQIPDAVQAARQRSRASATASRRAPTAGCCSSTRSCSSRAGLPDDWQPTSWDEITAAALSLKTLPGVTPIQLNAGTAMTEATAMQGVLPLLVGTGSEIYADGKWQGDTDDMKAVLDLYQKVYNGGLGDPVLQQEAKGRDKSFEEFAAEQDRHPAGERLLLALGRRPDRRRGEDGRPGHRGGLGEDPRDEPRVRCGRSGLRQHVRRRRPGDQPEDRVPAAGVGAAGSS